MMQQQLLCRIPRGVIAGVVTLALVTGCGRENQTVTNNTPTPSPVQQEQQQTAQVYLVEAQDNKIQLVGRPVASTKTTNQNPKESLEEAFNRLLSGSTGADAGVSSSIPQGTKLRSLAVKNDTVSVDLSKEFTSGGGTASMQSRLGQVIYTATSLNPKAKVYISVEGKPLTELGGEGLTIDQPMTRQSFDADFQL
ncbi:MAG TPA: spore germination protein [Cyanobacteria bacterium UBA11369]|nr:spore germination protein [Cyanobacteria bacterium UBA11371]HBE35319.1 spore germination protein [Cyanobacteria bacterium UBA11368]HBE47667.1 spore germination protein [Cyanobacteria bacterium UBA11369]